MASSSSKHHLSFVDHISLYLPHPLRPPLPRDLRPPPSPSPVLSVSPESSEPSTASTPVRSGSRERTENQAMGDSSEKQRLPEESRQQKDSGMVGEALSKGKSREGYHVSLILTNSGSVARDHLASERTFLAYVRTSLALASTGVALVQLFTIAENSTTPGKSASAEKRLVRHFSTPLGSALIILGFLVLLSGCLRYFAIQTGLTRGVFPAARMTVVFIVVVLSAITGLVFGVLLKGRSGT